jgi:hypothetical protein
MEIVFPQDPVEWIAWIVPMLAILTGFYFLLLPGRAMDRLGLTGIQTRRQAFAEARSGFAGFPIGLGLSAIMFGQSVLLVMLGLAFAIGAAGMLIRIVFDGERHFSLWLRLAIAMAAALLVRLVAVMPPQNTGWPAASGEWIITLCAIITGLIGLACFLAPARTMALLKLAASQENPGAGSELRGMVSGYFLASAAGVLIFGGIFTPLAMSAAWVIAALGRLIAIAFDGCNDSYNWLWFISSLALGFLPLLVVFGYVG